MIGIGGDPETMAGLIEIYNSGDEEARQSVLQAYLIADDAQAIHEIATNATTDEEFEAAVHTLSVMGATEQLHLLGERGKVSTSLIHAYAIAKDFEALHKLALDDSNPEIQQQAIQGLGIIGGDEVNATLIQIYRSSDDPETRESALHGIMINDFDEGVLELFRASTDAQEKRDLLHMLVIMDSDAVIDIISATLEGNR